jgi:hypothetical protein
LRDWSTAPCFNSACLCSDLPWWSIYVFDL